VGGLLREARDEFDKGTNISLQQVIDDAVVVVVMPHAVDTVHIMPDGVPERRRVNILVSAHPATSNKYMRLFSPRILIIKVNNYTKKLTYTLHNVQNVNIHHVSKNVPLLFNFE